LIIDNVREISLYLSVLQKVSCVMTYLKFEISALSIRYINTRAHTHTHTHTQ